MAKLERLVKAIRKHAKENCDRDGWSLLSSLSDEEVRDAIIDARTSKEAIAIMRAGLNALHESL